VNQSGFEFITPVERTRYLVNHNGHSAKAWFMGNVFIFDNIELGNIHPSINIAPILFDYCVNNEVESGDYKNPFLIIKDSPSVNGGNFTAKFVLAEIEWMPITKAHTDIN